jgi:hypothetical protein
MHCIICKIEIPTTNQVCIDCTKKYKYDPKQDNIADNYKFPEIKVTQEDIDKVNILLKPKV